MSTIRKGIESFLSARKDESPYLIPRWSPELETQFNVHPGNQETEEGSKIYTDGSEEWCNHRWPFKANSSPFYKDRPLRFDPRAHLTRVGSTWWNWVTKRSVAVAFDIDMTDEHAPSTTTVTETELDAVVERLKQLPYVTLLRSTGGKGVHIYVFFNEDDQPTAENHNEHTMVALQVLQKMKDDSDYDYAQHMDVKGVIFWFWADSSPADHPGYSLIQEATQPIGAADLSGYEAIKTPKKNRRVKGFDESGNEVESDGEFKVYELDDEHKSILRELEGLGYSFIWNSEFNMAHTHTCALKELYEIRKASGNPLRGQFETISQGTDKSKPNCYITPRPHGVFQVKRFGVGVTEHDLWNNHSGSTWCYYNQHTSADHVFGSFCASKKSDSTFLFEPEQLKAAMEALGHKFEHALQGAVQVQRMKDGTFVVFSEAKIPGWTDNKQGSKLTLPVISNPEVRETTTLEDADKIVRHLLTSDLDSYGWAIKTNKGWILHNESAVSLVLKQNFGTECNFVKEALILNPWELTCEPFRPEYLGDRKWNKNAPQLAIEPACEPGPHPHWDMVYEHIGHSLNDSVRATEWCQRWGLQSGADYLRCWMAALIRYPFEPLPYLFLYGPQDSGKSIFHESASMLFTPGSVVSASGALTNGQGFNYELANCVIGYIEEKDLSVIRDGTYARMKEWVTGRTLTVTEKGKTPYTQPNILKMVQIANSPKACPMEDGDTRITALAIYALGARKLAKGIMERKLLFEAPFFLRTILTTHLPESHDRLRVPMLGSRDKEDLEAMNQRPWEAFATDELVRCDGNLLKFTDFYEAYLKFCTLNNKQPESNKALLQLMRNRSDKYIIGYGPGKSNYIANFKLRTDETAQPGVPYILNEKNGRLVKCIT